jgi:hypothetical protein
MFEKNAKQIHSEYVPVYNTTFAGLTGTYADELI